MSSDGGRCKRVRGYTDVRPLQGVSTGRAEQDLEVQVRRLDGSWRAATR